ncbi:MAG TPA: ribonuclease HIII [Acholeplasma sp.]|nr:ribonuclease HIII [Acholeplasma sp.]
MKNLTLNLSKGQLEALKTLYQENLIKVEQPYIFFAAVHNDVKITAFNTGKVVIQGQEINSEVIAIKAYLNIKNYAAIGSDEVGTGDVFGPVVVCSVYASESDVEYLESLNVRDSKNMSNQDIIKIAPVIAKKLIHSLVILPPEKYNEKIKEGLNLNKIKAFLHNYAIIKTSAKIDRQLPVIVDQFCLPSHYYNYLKDEKIVYRDIEFHTKAETVHISVAAASIIARYAFLVKMHELSKKFGIKLKLGAGKEVDEQILEIYQKHGEHGLNAIAKTNFKNVTKLGLII